MVKFVTQTSNVTMSNAKPFRHFTIVINKWLITKRKFIETSSIKTRITPKGGIRIHWNTVNMKIKVTLNTRYFRMRRSNFASASSTNTFHIRFIIRQIQRRLISINMIYIWGTKNSFGNIFTTNIINNVNLRIPKAVQWIVYHSKTVFHRVFGRIWS